MDYLSKNIRYLSQQPGLGQLEAAKKTQLGQPAINKIANEKTSEAGYRTVAKLARFYGVTMDDLVTRDLEVMGRAPASQPAGLDLNTLSVAHRLLRDAYAAKSREYSVETEPDLLIAVHDKLVAIAGDPVAVAALGRSLAEGVPNEQRDERAGRADPKPGRKRTTG